MNKYTDRQVCFGRYVDLGTKKKTSLALNVPRLTYTKS